MIEQIKQIITGATNKLHAKSMVREYCQARILQFLQEDGLFRSWIFHGGTALRFLYRLPRYSEDLDFALEGTWTTKNFSAVINKVAKAFEAEAYSIDAKVDDSRTVKSAFVQFPGLLYDIDLSLHKSETLSIKIEVDSSPPEGGITKTSVIRRYVILSLQHYDKASFLSGKLHAILARPYVKGRDLYDLFWYLSDSQWPAPNIKFLNNALLQTNWRGPEITESNWDTLVSERLKSIKWGEAIKDTHPYIENASDLKLLTKENVLDTLNRRKP